MKKKIILVLCCIVAFVSLAPQMSIKAYTGVNVYVNGKSLTSEDTARLINGTTYVPLRAMCELFGADGIAWDDGTKTATISARGIKIYITQGNTYIVANGRYFASGEPVRNIGGRLYVPVRLIASAFAGEVEWNGASYTVRIKDSGGVPVSGDVYYDSTEVYWLSRIIYAESGAEPFRGKIAVGNVVMNRVRSAQFPNTISGVVYQKHAFTAVTDGQINLTPNETAMKAARDAINGWDPSGGAIYYYNPAVATSAWIFDRQTVTVIGKHVFAI